MWSLGFVYSFLDKQLNTSIQVPRWKGGREILDRTLPPESLQNHSSRLSSCLQVLRAQKTDKTKRQSITQVNIPDLSQKSK